MRYLTLACDYDGTLARGGHVEASTLAALERLRASGRRLILVTGRLLDDLTLVAPDLRIFERVVAENGALLYRPETREATVLCEAPPPTLPALLTARGVVPLSIGRAIVATWHPHETAALEAIRELGLEMQVIFNKGAVMLLPSGVNKASGLAAALTDLRLSPHNVVGIGDAENDHAFLSLCECAVAVANALPSLRERADFVTRGDHGAGVVELIDSLIESDLSEVGTHLERHGIWVGKQTDDRPVCIDPYGTNVLVLGSSGSGKSTFATAFLEQLAERKYQFCIVDPEGDYQHFDEGLGIGDAKHEPDPGDALALLEDPAKNAIVNLLAVPLHRRSEYFDRLLPRLLDLRARAGHPHWIVIDEAHHLLPESWTPAGLPAPQNVRGFLMITVHPESLSRAVLPSVDLVIAVGTSWRESIRRFAELLALPEPGVDEDDLEPGEVFAWNRRGDATAFRFRTVPPRAERRRHVRKYAAGELGEDKSFYFRGPEGQLNLRAQNLILFLQIADGVDDATWEHHRRRGDYSSWFREAIKDDALAQLTAQVEREPTLDAAQSRRRIRELIEQRYTQPA